MLRIIGVGLVALALPLTAAANIVVQSLRGDVQVSGQSAAVGQRLTAAVSVTTGPGAQVFLRFDDGMEVVLSEGSVLRVIDFRFSPGGATDRAVLELLRGGARVVTGKVAQTNPKQFFFRTPQTQLIVERPADFSVALVNPAYIRVNAGTVFSHNGCCVVRLDQGSASAIASNATPPSAILASAMPESAISAFNTLSLAQVTTLPGGVAAGLDAAIVGGAAQTTTQWVILGLIIAGSIAIIASQDDDASTPSHQ